MHKQINLVGNRGGTFHGYTTGTFRVPTKLICLSFFLGTITAEEGWFGHDFF
jgi:hypothetical protein